jgi:hypothetical protein
MDVLEPFALCALIIMVVIVLVMGMWATASARATHDKIVGRSNPSFPFDHP